MFCCFNNNCKITSDVFAIWMRILRTVEGSVIWLSASNDAAVANLRSQAEAHGVNPARLVFAPFAQPEARAVAGHPAAS